MEIINGIIRKTPVNKNLPFNPYCYRLVLVRANGTREELPGIMSLETASDGCTDFQFTGGVNNGND